MSHRETILEALRQPLPSEAELSALEKRVFETRAAKRRAPKLEWSFRVLAAASALLCLGAGYLWGRESGRAAHTQAPMAFPAPSAHTRFSDGSLVRAEAGTALTIEREDGDAVRIRQGYGVAHYDIVPGGPKAWSIVAGETLVEVLGTSFDVEYTTTGTRVITRSGHVRVTHADDVKHLHAGDVVEFVDPLPPPLATAPKAESARAPQAGAVALAAPLQGPPETKETFESLFAQSDQARAEKDMPRAISILEEAIRRFPKHEDVGQAAFTIGRIHHDALGNAPRALFHYERALRAGLPRELEESAQARLCEALRQSTPAEPERLEACLKNYLKRFPDGKRAGNVSSWLQELSVPAP